MTVKGTIDLSLYINIQISFFLFRIFSELCTICIYYEIIFCLFLSGEEYVKIDISKTY